LQTLFNSDCPIRKKEINPRINDLLQISPLKIMLLIKCAIALANGRVIGNREPIWRTPDKTG
jgi:hypothetical protein